MTSTLRGAQLTTIQPTDPSKRVTRCKLWSSYCHNPVAFTQLNTMYYIVIDGVQHGFSFQWEEALIEAAQQDFQLNSPELNDGIQGTHDVQIMSFQEMMEADDVVMVI
jgi:hypothetical protein